MSSSSGSGFTQSCRYFALFRAYIRLPQSPEGAAYSCEGWQPFARQRENIKPNPKHIFRQIPFDSVASGS